jgi:hypothetical protein
MLLGFLKTVEEAMADELGNAAMDRISFTARRTGN